MAKPQNKDPVAAYVDPLYTQLATETFRKQLLATEHFDPGVKFTGDDKFEQRSEASDEALVTFFDYMGIVGYSLNRSLGTSYVFWGSLVVSAIAAAIAARLGFLKARQHILEARDHKILKKLAELSQAYEALDEQKKSARKTFWEHSNRIQHYEARMKFQLLILDDELKITQDNITQLAALVANNKPAIPEFDQQHEKNYVALNNPDFKPTEKNAFRRSKAGAFLRWFIPILCVVGGVFLMIHGVSTATLVSFFESHIAQAFMGGAVLAGIIAVIAKEKTSLRLRKIVRERYEKAAVEYDANETRYKYLIELIEDQNKKTQINLAWSKITDHRKKRSPARVAMQNDLINGLCAVLTTPGDYEKFNADFLQPVINKDFEADEQYQDLLPPEEDADLNEALPLDALTHDVKRNLILSSIGFGLMWMVSFASVPGVNLTRFPTFMAFLTHPIGWITMGSSLVLGVAFAGIRAHFNRQKRIEERRERVQEYLLSYKLQYEHREKSNTLSPELKNQWAKTQKINDIAIRAHWQQKLLSPKITPQEMTEMDNAIEKDIIRGRYIDKPLPTFDTEKYNRYNENRLTHKEIFGLAVMATLTFCEFALPVLCAGGFAFFTVGISMATPLGWTALGLGVLALSVGTAFLIKNTYGEVKKIKADRLEKAKDEMEFNESEFNRLIHDFDATQKAALTKKWLGLKQNTHYNNPAKVVIQQDFLEGLKSVLANGQIDAVKYQSFSSDFLNNISDAAPAAVNNPHGQILAGLRENDQEQQAQERPKASSAPGSPKTGPVLTQAQDLSRHPSTPTRRTLPRSSSRPDFGMWRSSNEKREENIPPARSQSPTLSPRANQENNGLN